MTKMMLRLRVVGCPVLDRAQLLEAVLAVAYLEAQVLAHLEDRAVHPLVGLHAPVLQPAVLAVVPVLRAVLAVDCQEEQVVLAHPLVAPSHRKNLVAAGVF